MSQIENIGISEKRLSEQLKHILDLLKMKIDVFFVEPKLIIPGFLITANINLNGRRAPLRIIINQGDVFSEFVYSIESIICKSTELRKVNERNEIRNRLTNKSLELIENNDFILVGKKLNLHTSDNELFKVIIKVMQVADDLEEEFTGGDLEETLN